MQRLFTALLLLVAALGVGGANTINVGVPSNVYISSVSANGIGIGNDANPCSHASPCLTLDKAMVTVPNGGTIWLNGVATYMQSTATTISRGYTIRGVVAGQSTLASAGSTQNVLVAMASGQTATVRDLIIDPTQNAGGAGGACVTLSAQSTTFSIEFINVVFQGWGSGTPCIAAPSNLKANVLVANSTFTHAGASRGAIDVRTFIAGGIEARDNTVSVADVPIGFGGIIVGALATGPYGRLYNNTVTVGTTATAVGTIYGILCMNIAGCVVDGDSNNTGTRAVVSVSAPVGSTSSYVLGVGTNDSAGVSEFPCDGSIVRNYISNNDANGGIGAYIGGESGDPDKSLNMVLGPNVTVYGTPRSQTFGFHGLMNGSSRNGTIRDSQAYHTGIAIVDKLTYNSVIQDVLVQDCTSTCALAKGSTDPSWTRITVIPDAPSSVSMYRASYCSGCGASPYPGIVWEGRPTTNLTITDSSGLVDGTSGNIALYAEAGGTGKVTTSGMVFNTANGGTYTSVPFRYQTNASLTPNQWRSIFDTTATGNIFSGGILSPVFGIQMMTPSALPAGATLTRGGSGTRFNQSGALVTETTNVARFNWNPSTFLAEGYLVEAARTNSLRNSTMAGVSAGTPGTVANFWTVTSTADSVTREVVGTATEDGLDCSDIKYSGTPSGTGSKDIIFEGTTQVAAASGQTWTGSQFTRLIAGALTNATVTRNVVERDSGGAALATTSATITPTSARVATQRTSTTRTLNNGSTAAVTNGLSVGYTNGQAINLTLRVCSPQLEQGADVSSVIKTSTVAVTRAADVLTVTAPNGTYGHVHVARLSGDTDGPGVTVSGGVYTVPTSSSPLQLVLGVP